MDRESLEIAAHVARVFEELGIAYFLGGSAASSHYGIPRSTNDIDLIAAVRAEDVEGIVAALTDEFYVEPDVVADAVARGASFSLIHWEKVIKLDVFIAGSSRFRAKQLARAAAGQVLEFTFHIASPEDIILAKLRWYRDGGEVSDRQLEDVLGVITVQADRLDLDYLRTTADELGVRDLLETALANANH